MTVKREYLDYVADIQEAVSSILVFTDSMTWEQFAADRKTQYAVVRAFEILGEAAKKVPMSVRKRHAGVPWKQMAGMRDKLIHEYFGVNFQIVWEIATNDLPLLKQQFFAILNEL